MIPIKLTQPQKTLLREMDRALCVIVAGNFKRTPSTVDLARLKARCEEFLAVPVVQALNPEGL